MVQSEDIPFYRRLLAGHRSALSRSGRVGSIILDWRPAPILADGKWPAATVPREMPAAQLDLLARRVAECAPSVGVIEVDFGGMTRFATCFRVSDDPHRVITARHVASGVLNIGARLECRPDAPADPFPGLPAYRSARVLFEAQTGFPDETRDVEGIEWAHDEWDLMLLRLALPSARPKLVLAPPRAPAIPPPPAWVCVLGYPLLEPADPQSGGFSDLFPEGLGPKRASPGLINPPNAGDRPGLFRHDATTLGGNSGGPVIALDSGEVIGLHVRGGSGPASPNLAVHLPDVLAEDALRGRLLDDPLLAAAAPIAWPGSGRPRSRRGLAFELIRSDGDEYAELSRPGLAEGLGVLPDRFDSRDRFYQPPLEEARVSLLPDRVEDEEIGVQKDPYSCTGFALAAAINRQLRQRPRRRDAPPQRVSPVMLYALATRHDEFLDDRPGGSSLRGAIKGFFHFGVCSEATAPYARFDPDWHLTIAAAKEARHITLGAYYRLRPVLSDYHLAVQQAGAVLVSAHLHSGWTGCRHSIPHRQDRLGAHAFIITGYDDKGFIVQNSWGPGWADWKGRRGMARWSYADWAENVIDAWVLRLAPPTPAAFDLQVRNDPARGDTPPMPPGYARLRDARRSVLVGHSLHIERDGIRGSGRLGVGPASIRETALHLGSEEGRRKYRGVALIFHDAATEPDPVARLAAHMIEPLKANRIYPMHIHYGADEMRSLVVRMLDEGRIATARAQGSGEDLTGYLRRRALMVARPLMQGWIEGCRAALLPGGGLWQAMASVGLEAGGPEAGAWVPPRLHLLGIGSGALVAGLSVPALEGQGFGTPASFGSVAGWDLPGMALSEATRRRRWQLDRGAARDVAIAGLDGDWCDLLALLSDGEGPGPRHENRAGWGRDLASAITEPALLNAILGHMLGRPPARTLRFV